MAVKPKVFVTRVIPDAGLKKIKDFCDAGQMTVTFPQIGTRIAAVVRGHSDVHREQVWLSLRADELPSPAHVVLPHQTAC